MFGLFYSLILAMFKGTWINYSTASAIDNISAAMGNFIRSFSYVFQSFGLNVHTEGLTDYNEIIDTTTAISNDLSANAGLSMQDAIAYSLPDMIAGILAVIVSIGIIMITVKGIKKVFSIFFMGIRR